ncbi:MAG: hypothetical protein WC813_03880 [Patescibacteria group bacterium]|jgi:hypothetical protein
MKINFLKWNERVQAFVVIAFGITGAAFMMISSLKVEWTGVGESIALSLFVAFVLDLLGTTVINRTEKMRADFGTAPSTFEKASLGINVIRFILGVAFYVAIVVAMGYFLMNDPRPLHITSIFLAQAATFLVYFLILRRFLWIILRKIGPTLQPPSSKFRARYTLTNQGILLDLGIVNLSDRDQPSVVELPFSDLQEIQVMTYGEVEQYMRFKAGLSFTDRVRMQAQSVTDMMKYLKKEVARPRYYLHGGTQGKTLVLKGNELLYVVSVANENCDDLLSAFAEYRKN